MHVTFIQRLRIIRRPLDNARPRVVRFRRHMHDPLAFARGLMNAFALSILVWVLIALGLVSMS